MQVKFYKCETCGNIALKVVDKGPSLYCCGNPMVELVPDSQEAATEKHIPDVKMNGDTMEVQIGSVLHPTLEEHHIQFICLVTEDAYQIHPIAAGVEPRATFELVAGDKPVCVYEYCNIHGLWVYNF